MFFMPSIDVDGLEAVDVPGDLVEDGRQCVDRYETHTASTSRRASSSTVRIGSCRNAHDLRGFFRQIESVFRLGAGHQAISRLKVLVQQLGVIAFFKFSDLVIDNFPHSSPSCHSNRANFGRRQ